MQEYLCLQHVHQNNMYTKTNWSQPSMNSNLYLYFFFKVTLKHTNKFLSRESNSQTIYMNLIKTNTFLSKEICNLRSHLFETILIKLKTRSRHLKENTCRKCHHFTTGKTQNTDMIRDGENRSQNKIKRP